MTDGTHEIEAGDEPASPPLNELLCFEFDRDGCPTDSTLMQISAYTGSHRELMKHVAFMFGKYGRCEAHGNIWKVATGGWSGCESVIRALQANNLFWIMCWRVSKRGGYFEFETTT